MTATARPFGRIGQPCLPLTGASARMPQTCAVSLIDRRTGRPHRINGKPLVLFTRAPDLAVEELLSGRDALVWEARVEPISPDALMLAGGP